MDYSDIQQQLDSFFSKETISVNDLLVHPDLYFALKENYKPLLEYLCEGNNIVEVAKKCLNRDIIKNDKIKKISVAAINVFLNVSLFIFKIIMKNEKLLTFLYNFLKSDDSNVDDLACNFYKIINRQIEGKDGFAFFHKVQFGDILDIFIEKLDNSIYQDLFIEILLIKNIEIDNKIIIKLSKTANSNDKKNYVCGMTIYELFMGSDFDSNIYLQFFDEVVLNNLIEASIRKISPVLSINLINIVYSITRIDMGLKYMNENQSKVLKISKDNINFLSIAAIDLFDFPIEYIFEFFFLSEDLHYKLSEMMLHMSKTDLLKIIQIPNFLNNLVTCYHNGKWCPHMTQIANLFYINKIETNNQRWEEFYKKEIYPKLLILNSNYGDFDESHFVHKEEEEIFEEEEEEESDEFYDIDINID